MYKIERYKNRHKEEVAELLTDLWGNNKKENILNFEYKYEKNPFDDEIYAVVALQNDKVVGFRGFVPSKWTMLGKDIWFLLVADANVHIEHRRKGLFQQMTLKALEIFQESKFIGYLNLTSNEFSFPGYLKLGWKKIYKKEYIRFTDIFSFFFFMLRIKQPKNKKYDIESANIVINDIDDALKLNSNSKSIQISEIKKLYTYKTLRMTYKCKKYIENNENLAYITIVEGENNRCTIVDFNYKSIDSFTKLIKELRKRYYVVSIWEASINKLEIKKPFITRIIKRIEKQRKNHILYRPIKKNYTDIDLYLEGVNLLDVNNWCFKQIIAE